MVHTYPYKHAHTHENIKKSDEMNYKKMMDMEIRKKMQKLIII